MAILVLETPSVAPIRHISSTTDIADQPEPLSPTTSSTDGWGDIGNGISEDHESDKDGWDDIEPLEEPKPPAALANIQAAQKRPVSQPVKPQGNTLPTPFQSQIMHCGYSSHPTQYLFCFANFVSHKCATETYPKGT